MSEARAKWVGNALPRIEDPTLLRGAGQFADDLGEAPGTCHVAFVRSPHAHAVIERIERESALALDGVIAVLTGAELARIGKPFITAVKVAAPQYPLAVDRVRYVGEAVALVVAKNRYRAEDAADLVQVDYRVLPPVIDPQTAAEPGAQRLHPDTSGNVLHERSFSYGTPAEIFANAYTVVATHVRYPRNACTPVECCCVSARHDPGTDTFEVAANFQGPYTLHPVMARALGVPGNRLRLRTPPDSGGSFGVKQSLFPYVVAIGLAAKRVGRPLKWLEDRLEHLSAATAATNRVTHIRGAFSKEGGLLALDYDQLEDCGAYLRAPEPATLYRMHGNMTGAYAVPHLTIRNRVVVTNKTPTGLNRGFGGPQVYFALERLMDEAAKQLAVDPFALRERNLVRAESMPYRTAPGALLDSGDYRRTMRKAMTGGRLAALQERRDRARAAGRLYGIGCAAVVEPSVSNMGYITTLLSPAERERAGAKNGALATATVSFDPSGSVSVRAASIPQGQGHRTVLAQVVADVFGLRPGDVAVVMDHDTAKDPWSIASGNYSSRFAGAVAGAAHRAATALRERITALAAADLNVLPEEVEFAEGQVRALANPDNALALGRCAAKAHWSPLSIPTHAGAGLHETAMWTMPELTEPDGEDRVNASGTYGFIFDFCGIEIDRDTAAVRIDEYISAHDAGTLLNPVLADGQIRGGFAHGLGAALYEEFAYSDDGTFLSGNFADYLPPTAMEIPPLTIVHDENPSPFTPLGAKGLGEGNCISTPVCIANAVADALGCHIATLPLTRSRLAPLIWGEEAPARAGAGAATDNRDPALTGSGKVTIPAPRERVWAALTGQAALARLLPGCEAIEPTSDGYRARLSLGVGPVRGRFETQVRFTALQKPAFLRVSGSANGPLGATHGDGSVILKAVAPGAGGESCTLSYRFETRLSGKVAAVGGRLLDGAAKALLAQIFARLAAQLAQDAPRRGLLERLGLRR
ncbi:MAG: molybdopterin-dependent oxidoreductase [Gammaproteobacteria bacterium]|nr:molybdopterin-dependent oxidoreductase [Gammaproteobacteria bacterium]